MPHSMLDVLRRIIQQVNAARDLSQALQIVVHAVRDAMRVDAASVYFLDADTGRYVLMAQEGLSDEMVGRLRIAPGEGLVGLVVERAEPVNVEDAPSHPRYRHTLQRENGEFHGFLGIPIIQHRRVLGVLVVRQVAQRRFSETDEAFLLTLAAQLAGAITQAEATGGISRLIEEVSGRVPFMLRGRPGSPGVAIGRAHVVFAPANLERVPERKVEPEAVEAEVAAFREAVDAVRGDIQRMARRMEDVLPAEELALFDVFSMMLGSDTLVDETIARIREGRWAPAALRDTIAEHVRLFEAMEDPYLRERASDIRDLGRRILAYLQARHPPRIEIEGPVILVGEEVAAFHLAEVPRERLGAVVSARGSGTSHVAILARALGVPAVMGVEDLPVGQLQGQELIVDGYEGRIFVKPSDALRQEFDRLRGEERELAAGLESLHDLPAETPDGVRMPLYVNTGLLSDITPSLESGAEGVGLYRTEVPFLVREHFPGEDEQVRIYRHVLEGFAPRPVILRTLDVGGDKPLPYFPIQEDNPFLGWRGIRLTLDHPEIFLTQLRAILRAGQGLDNLQLMLPMITEVAEVEETARLLWRATDELLEDGIEVPVPPMGVMIEVPAAVYQIDAIARRVDFVSIGTNDLTQYLLAVDRNNAQVAELYDGLHPAVIEAILQVVEGAHRHGRPVGVCGELAGDPAAAILLLAAGVDSLSMSVASLPRVKWAIRSLPFAEARRLLDEARGLQDARAIRRLLNEALDRAGVGGLIRAGK